MLFEKRGNIFVRVSYTIKRTNKYVGEFHSDFVRVLREECLETYKMGDLDEQDIKDIVGYTMMSNCMLERCFGYSIRWLSRNKSSLKRLVSIKAPCSIIANNIKCYKHFSHRLWLMLLSGRIDLSTNAENFIIDIMNGIDYVNEVEDKLPTMFEEEQRRMQALDTEMKKLYPDLFK